MNIDGVFSGGGVKALAFIGALEVLDENGYRFQRVAGTSAGAIVACLIASGYQAKDLKKILVELSLEKLIDTPFPEKFLPFYKWLLLYFRMGLFKGNRLENLLEKWLEQKGVHTFADLPHGSLKVICSDLTLGKMVVIPDDLHRLYGIDPDTFSVAKAARISAGLPYFFMPVKLHGKKGKSLLVDGGVLSNFPIWLFENEQGKRRRPILGMQLSDPPDQLPEQKIKNSIQMFHALFRTMKKAHDARYISESTSRDVIFIPVKGVETTDFSMNADQKEKLMSIGKEKAKQFLDRWKK
ncbi:patatin-like phospholipase family protein [Halobacillus naozhouensis]|uniref:Patatin-like phospholipase family protein n=1 Tax=Halobacillus naozhouensis TaxID=554880 RepID=A0ABY8J5X1_9BACI|nr:patatin-like phospholipase family protein [Halobacillus naozhouensis]WFT76969.1 patatin-like phospholipase family protein [Halobacillus naozhouensis]